MTTSPASVSKTGIVSQSARCSFNGCPKPPMEASTKCSFHRNRSQCTIPKCTNQVYARQLCVRHGGKRVCTTHGCTSHACGGGHCLKHGGYSRKRFCLVEGCGRQAHKNQKCVRHGGGRYCKTPHCTSHARFKGFCLFHHKDLEPIQLDGSSGPGYHNVFELDAIDSAILECLASCVIDEEGHSGDEDSSSVGWQASPRTLNASGPYV